MPTAWPGSVAPTRQSAALGEGRVSWLEREGSDPPVLMLHGWGASAATFSGLLQLSRTPRRLVALDLPGFGESPLGSASWTRASYAQLVRQLLISRGWPRATVLGHSYGGGVAVRLAGESSPPLDRLILCAASGFPIPGARGVGARVRTFRALRKGAETALPEKLSRPAVEWLRQRFGSADYRSAGPLRPILVRAVQEDLSSVAEQIKVPTLIIWGGRDQELPVVPYGRRLRELIPPSELVEFEGSGHYPFVDEPGRFASVFDSFVDAEI
ncbi:MAG: alpha/beta hydrolase [Candidatus Dormiibacterota bacterium]